MKRSRFARVGSGVAGVAMVAAAVAFAGPAAADQYITVSGTTQCVGQSYTLSVAASKIQTGTTAYVFLEGASLSNTTQIGTQQSYHSGQTATATWTPTTSGTHDLWMRGIETNGGYTIGPVPVTVQAAGSPGCSSSTGTGSADSLPVIGNLLSSLGL